MAGASFHIGLLLFPRLTRLDLTGPYEVFARMPGAAVNLLWKSLEPVQSDRGLAILPTATLETCPPLDLVCVPGGPGGDTHKIQRSEEHTSELQSRVEIVCRLVPEKKNNLHNVVELRIVLDPLFRASPQLIDNQAR